MKSKPLITTCLRREGEAGEGEPRREAEKDQDPFESFSDLNSIRRFFFSFVLGLLFWSLVVWFTIHPQVP